MRNTYAKRSRISEAKIRELVRYVAADLTALQAAALSGLNRNTVNRLYRGVRERMRLACKAQRPLFGVVEVDESFFGARRVKGRRGRGAYGKTVVFGIFERQGRVYTEIVPDCSKPTLQGIIRGRVDPRTIINSDGWRGYHGLVDLGYGGPGGAPADGVERRLVREMVVAPTEREVLLHPHDLAPNREAGGLEASGDNGAPEGGVGRTARHKR